MNKYLKQLLIVTFATALLVLAGTGCKNTAHGVGEDMEEAGEKIQKKTK